MHLYHSVYLHNKLVVALALTPSNLGLTLTLIGLTPESLGHDMGHSCQVLVHVAVFIFFIFWFDVTWLNRPITHDIISFTEMNMASYDLPLSKQTVFIC